MKVLITGATGFVGSHLVDYLLENEDVYIYGSFRHRSNWENVQHVKDKVTWIDCNVTDATAVSHMVKRVRPDVISHLAAQSFVPTSWVSPQDTFDTNVISTINILEAVREYCHDCIVQIAGSSEEYGKVLDDEVPINENNALRPLSPYGVSKVAQDLLAQQYARSYNLNVRISRAFNHEGPRRGSVFVTSAFAKQVIAVGRRKTNVIKVGNLSAVRDFTDVRDVVRAYWLLITKCKSFGPYNICSGTGITMENLLNMFLSVANVEEYIIDVSKELLRPSDVPVLIGDCNKFIDETGWEPKISLRTTIYDILEYWRNNMK